VVFLQNFFDELRRRVPAGKGRQLPIAAGISDNGFIGDVLDG